MKTAARREYERDWRNNPANAAGILKSRKRRLVIVNERNANDPEYRALLKARTMVRLRVPEKRLARLLTMARWRAKKTGRQFSITLADLLPAPSHCPVLGIELDYATTGQYDRNWNRASVDRVDNLKGYVPGNVRVISNRANSLKSNATVDELAAILAYMKSGAA